MAAGNDAFANYAILTTVETAANTLTFKKLETGISLTEKVAWVINRVEYFPSPNTAAQYNGDGDVLYFGLSLSNAFSAVSLSESTIIDLNALFRLDFGAPATSHIIHRPIVKDFSSLPGGGLLVPPNPIYGFTQGSGLVSASTVYARMHYTLRVLKIDEFWELVEARRILTS